MRVGAVQDVYGYFRVLGDRKRLAIVRYLAKHGELSVTSLSRSLRLSQPLMSWHLRLLRKAGIVKTRRMGRQVFCSLDIDQLMTYEQRVDKILGLSEASTDAADIPTLALDNVARQ